MEETYINENHDFDSDRDLLTSAISSILGEMTISDRLHVLMDRLGRFMEARHGQKNIQEAIDILLQEIAEGIIDRRTVRNLNSENFFSRDMEVKEERLIELSLIYTAIAQLSLGDNMIMRAWRAMADAEHYLSYLDGLKESTFYRKTDRAQKGGNKKAQNARLLKKAFITLLKDKKPKMGWRNPSLAANSIVGDLIEMASKEDFPVPDNKDDLIYSLINQINEDKEVNQAFS